MDSKLLNDSLTLEEKLKLIDEKMKELEMENKSSINGVVAPVDPSIALACDGCQ